MKKLVAKMRKVRMIRWNKLTTGEKVMRVIMILVKAVAIIAVVAAVVSVALAAVAGIVVGFAIMSAVAGGFRDASRAYRTGDRYVRFW